MADRYKIEGEIGAGGEGSVYKAFDTLLKRHVALKRVLTKDRATSEEVEKAADSLVAEAQTLSALNHPNIVTVYDVGKDEEGGYVVMELIKGETLDEVVTRGVLTEEDFNSFATQTMEALMAAQEINMIHRDLKPGNVMIVWLPGGRFQAKILDFGLAKFSEVPSLQTLGFDDSVMGSIYFMAPEQFERAELDERTDLYAMGCVYYFALTAKRPFDGKVMTLVMVSHLQHQVVSLEKIRPDLPPALCQWVMWLINREIDDRPESAEVALKHLPKNSTKAMQHELMGLPVNNTRTGLTTGVQVVMPTHSVEAPTGLVVAPGMKEPEPVIEEPQEPVLTEPFDEARYDEEYPSESPRQQGGGILRFIGIGIVVLGLGYFGWTFISGIDESKDEGVVTEDIKGDTAKKHPGVVRLEELAAMEHPTGSGEDVNLVMIFLALKEATSTQKNQAREVFARLKGSGVDEAILAKFRSAKLSADRVWLSQVLAARGGEGIVPVLIAAIGVKGKSNEQLEILNTLRILVTVENVQPVIDSLKRNYNPKVRSDLEQVVASAFRRIPATQSNLAPLMARLDTAGGSERASLWRILGMRGGDVITRKLEQVFLREKHDEGFLRDAMGALEMMHTPRIVNLLNNVYSTTRDAQLKVAASNALAHAITVPSNARMDERRFWWQLALKIVTKPQDLQQVFNSIAEYTDPAAIEFLEGVSNSRTFGVYSNSAINRIQQLEKGSPIIVSGELLAVNQQCIRAKGALFDPDARAITNWVDPKASFVWHFKLKEAGEYKVEILQAMGDKGGSQFSVIIGRAILSGKATDTGGWTEYKPNPLTGSVRLVDRKTYTLFLVAGEVVQPQMMNFKGVRLQKQ